jgi:hypothetical protein
VCCTETGHLQSEPSAFPPGVLCVLCFVFVVWVVVVGGRYGCDHPRDARSPRQVPLLRGDILAVSSQPLQIAQRDFGMRFMCV